MMEEVGELRRVLVAYGLLGNDGGGIRDVVDRPDEWKVFEASC